MANERSILFSAPMIRAILDKRKTQTRRICKLQDERDYQYGGAMWTEEQQYDRCPYRVGRHLWVRETWRIEARNLRRGEPTYLIDYRADPGSPTLTSTDHPDAMRWVSSSDRYRPSIFMPRWASRLTLEVTGIRVERVQDISEADAWAEGVQTVAHAFSSDGSDGPTTYTDAFADLWDSINAARGYPWEASPWVWVVEFRSLG